jgi:hypothetical protein
MLPGKARWLGIGGIVLLAVAVAAGLAVKPGASVPSAGLTSKTATVVRATLRDARIETGTLNFGEPVDVPFVSRASTGMVTWLAPEGSTVSRGQPLYGIDGQPVILLYGELPFFRTLRFDGASFEDFEWLELNNASDDQHKAELNVAVQQARLAEAEARLEEARIHVEDGQREQPITPQFVRLSAATTAARDRLRRIEQLAESGFTTPAEVQQARYELAAAQAELDDGIRERTQQLAIARTAVSEARLAVHEAERTLRDSHDALNALLSIANANSDIELLRANLAALGYDGAAADAIRRWQADAGRSATGLIEPGQIVVAAGPIRVAEHLAETGDVLFGSQAQSGFTSNNNSTARIMRYTGIDRLVTVPLEIADHAYAKVGDEVVITLPTDGEVRGVLNEVSTVFDDRGLADTVIEISDQAALGSLETASVEVEFVIGSRADVLAVPIAALMALPGGGFGLEVVDGDSVRMIPVDTGLFARGSVEVSGPDVAEGLVVSIPQ